MTSSNDATRQEVGFLLRRAREEAGLSLRDLAQRTRIGTRHIEALEAGRYESLQGFIFVRGFVISICKELRKDPAEVLSLLKSMEPEEPEPLSPVQARDILRTKPSGRGGLAEQSREGDGFRRSPGPPTSLLLAGLYLVVISSLAFLALVMTGVVRMDRGAPPAAPAETRKTAGEAPPPIPEGAEPSPEAPAAVQLPAGAPSVPAPAGAAPAAGATRSRPAQAAELRLRVAALEKTWMKIQADEQPPQEVTLRKDGTAYFVARDHFTLTIGNAGGVTFELNDRKMGPPGAPGQVLSNYILNRDNL